MMPLPHEGQTDDDFMESFNALLEVQPNEAELRRVWIMWEQAAKNLDALPTWPPGDFILFLRALEVQRARVASQNYRRDHPA